MSGTLRLKGSTSGYSELQAPAVAGDQTFILPVEGGTLLTTDSPFPTLTLESGTVTSPSLTFEGDSNTGIYSPGTNELAITTSGVQRLVTDSNGNVGIGTSSPGAPLEVAGTGSPTFRISDLDGTNQFGQILANNGTFVIESRNDTSDGQIIFRGRDSVGTNEYGRFDGNGNFGIGKASPETTLHLRAASPVITLEDGVGSLQTSISGDGGELAYSIAGSEAMRIDSGGNVGIGTTSPKTGLHFAGSTPLFTIEDTSGATAGIESTCILRNNDNFEFQLRSSSNTFVSTFYQVVLQAGGANRHTWKTSNTERMRLDSSGRLGIGTISPDYLLHVDTPIVSGFERTAELSHGADTNFKLMAANGAFSNSSGEEVSRFGIYYQGTGWDSYIKYIRGNGAQAGTIAFSTANSESMRIDASGAVRLSNPTANPSLGSNTIGVQVSGGVLIVNSSSSGSVFGRNNNGSVAFFQRNGTNVGNISVTTTNTSYNTSSDYRLKENVVDLDSAIDRVKQLAPKRFNFIVDADTTVDGFLAHEAQTVVPEAVTGTHNEVDDDGDPVYQGIDQSKLVPLLTAALQEAISKIETLETKVTSLEAGS